MLRASAEVVWEAASSMEGVNHELGPWLRMTAPAGLRIDPADVVPGERLFRSRLLLLGVLPIDFDDLTFVRVDAGRGFLERSPMLSAQVWEHERVIEPVGDGCRVTDRVRFIPRVPFAGRVHRLVVAAIFRHRHRRLPRRFG